jgi:hypothetical protein
VYEGFHLTPLKLGPTDGALGTDHGMRSKQRIGGADAEQIARDVGSELSGADIRLSFVGELAGRWAATIARARAIASGFGVNSRVRRFQARPAYLAAVERAGAYALAE